MRIEYNTGPTAWGSGQMVIYRDGRRVWVPLDPPTLGADIVYRYTLATIIYAAGIALAWGLA